MYRRVQRVDMTWNVPVGRPVHESVRSEYDDWADVTVAADDDSSEALDTDIDTFDAMVVAGVELTAERIERASNLKVVTSPGVGVDAVGIGAATDRVIVVRNDLATSARTRARSRSTASPQPSRFVGSSGGRTGTSETGPGTS